MMKATDYLAEALVRHGVDTVFGYQGSSVAHIIDSLSSHESINFIESRNEQGAAFAANGFSLASGRLGVAVACSGPGALNLVSGIANAYYDSIPCLFVTGQVSQREMKHDDDLRQYGFQETDIVSIVRPIIKSAISLADVQDLPKELEKSIRLALEGRKGPVLLDIPHNIQTGNLDVRSVMRTDSDEKSMDEKTSLSDAWLRDISIKINNSRRPVVLVGGGCSDIAESLWRELDECDIPVVTSYRGKGFFDNDSPLYCGTIGVFGSRAANWALKYSDFILCLGTRLDGRQTAYEPLQVVDKQNVVVIDIDEAELCKQPVEYFRVCCDAEMALKGLLPTLKSAAISKRWLSTIKKWHLRFPTENEYRISKKVNPNSFLADLSSLASPSANFSLDVGQNQLWANNSLCIGSDRRLIQSAGLGAMGFSIPAGVGAYYANGNQTVCIVGDGGIQMNLQELQTVSQYKIPLKVFIMQNDSLGLIRDYQRKALGSRYYGSIEGFSSPSYRLIAEAFSMKYARFESSGNERDLEALLNDGDAWLVEVSIDQFSTSHPDPTYGSSLINQSAVLSTVELDEVRGEAYAIE